MSRFSFFRPGGLRLPFFYGWVLVAISFVTMAVGVNARTAFSLLFPAILDDFGWDRGKAAWALGLVSLVAVPGEIGVGHLSDRIGREWVWTIGNAGFVLCCAALIALRAAPTAALLWIMVVAQGTLGYSLTSVMGAIPAEIFERRRYGSIFGTVMLAAITGGAAGPWLIGVLHDLTGAYSAAFWLAAGCSVISAAAIWLAAPGKVRSVAGRAGRAFGSRLWRGT